LWTVEANLEMMEWQAGLEIQMLVVEVGSAMLSPQFSGLVSIHLPWQAVQWVLG